MKRGVKAIAVLGIVGLLVGLSLAPAAARPTWKLFGDAKFVKEGVGSDPWALRIRSDASPAFGGVAWSPDGPMTFADLLTVSTDFRVTEADCGGGSPRFSISLDTTGDGVRDGSVFVYLGPVPNFSGCGSAWQSSGNLIEATDTRFDSTQFGGPFYGTHAGTLALVGSGTVTRVSLVVDSSWLFGTQTVLVDNVTVNDSVLSNPGLGSE